MFHLRFGVEDHYETPTTLAISKTEELQQA